MRAFFRRIFQSERNVERVQRKEEREERQFRRCVVQGTKSEDELLKVFSAFVSAWWEALDKSQGDCNEKDGKAHVEEIVAGRL